MDLNQYVRQGQSLQGGLPQAWEPQGEDKKKEIPSIALDRTADPRRRQNALDSPEAETRLKHLMRWRRQARVGQADNRLDMAMDEDYYDSIQYEPEDLHILMQRNQAPLVFNIVKKTVNWILGTEQKLRIDYRVLPRNKKDAQPAKTKTKLIKYTQDVSNGEYARSEAFRECICAGLGWMEYGALQFAEDPIFMRQERWRNMWFDHLGMEPDGSDWRYEIREKWIDLDIVQGMFPERADRLRVLSEAVNSLYPYLPDDLVVTDYASEFDLESDLDSLFGGPFDSSRERVKVTEMWYRMPAYVQMMKARDNDNPFGAYDNTIFRANNPDHQYLVRGKYFTLTDWSYMMVVRCAMWAGATYLQDILTPYNHNAFPIVPMFCYRRKRDNMPYGMIRDIRDPQRDFNMRRSRSLALLTGEKVAYEKESIDDPVDFYEENQRSDGMMLVNSGALTMNKIRFLSADQRAAASVHMGIAQQDEAMINAISGVTSQNEGATKQDLSGKAIGYLQNEGQTIHIPVFGNYYFNFKQGGEILNSLIEQYYDQQKQFLISGDKRQDDFVTINEKQEDGTIKNSIIANKARFIVSKQDFRESIRMSMLETLSTLIQNLSKGMPQVALALLDEYFDMMDELPNKDEMVARIRAINGQHGAEDEMSPDEKQKYEQAKQQAEQEKNALKQIQQAMAMAELSSKQADAQSKDAKATLDKISGEVKKLEGFLKALEAAREVGATPGVVNAADVLIKEAEAAGFAVKGNNGNTPKQVGPSRQIGQQQNTQGGGM